MKTPLEAYRKSKDLTHKQLAELLSCSRSQAHAWCTGRAIPRAMAMAKIVEVTEGAVTANDFFDAATPAAESPAEAA